MINPQAHRQPLIVIVFSATVVVIPASVCVVVTVTVIAFGLTGTMVMPAKALELVSEPDGRPCVMVSGRPSGWPLGCDAFGAYVQAEGYAEEGLPEVRIGSAIDAELDEPVEVNVEEAKLDSGYGYAKDGVGVLCVELLTALRPVYDGNAEGLSVGKDLDEEPPVMLADEAEVLDDDDIAFDTVVEVDDPRINGPVAESVLTGYVSVKLPYTAGELLDLDCATLRDVDPLGVVLDMASVALAIAEVVLMDEDLVMDSDTTTGNVAVVWLAALDIGGTVVYSVKVVVL